MIIKNHRIESIDTDFRSDNILLFDFKNKSWLAKLFFKVFKRFGEPVQSREFLVKERLEDQDIVRYIYDQQSLLEHFAKKTPKYLILGHDAMRELKIRTTYGSFVLGESFEEGYVRKRFAGLTVILMPSMSGVLVLHDICEGDKDSNFSSSSVAKVQSIEKI